jgi:hypothetical protein
VTYDRLKLGSFTHSAIYTALLVAWLVPGLHGAEMVLGWMHGIGWIVMSSACIVAVQRRIVPLRVAVAVAVLGGVGPFFGSYMFVRERRAREWVG